MKEKATTDRRSADGKGQKVGERRDGDGDAGPTQNLPELFFAISLDSVDVGAAVGQGLSFGLVDLFSRLSSGPRPPGLLLFLYNK